MRVVSLQCNTVGIEGERFDAQLLPWEATMVADKSGKPWTADEVKQLRRQLAKENTPTRVIGIKLERTPDAVQSKAQRQGIWLKPTNQSPYGTKGRRL